MVIRGLILFLILSSFAYAKPSEQDLLLEQALYEGGTRSQMAVMSLLEMATQGITSQATDPGYTSRLIASRKLGVIGEIGGDPNDQNAVQHFLTFHLNSWAEAHSRVLMTGTDDQWHTLVALFRYNLFSLTIDNLRRIEEAEKERIRLSDDDVPVHEMFLHAIGSELCKREVTSQPSVQ